MSGTAVPHFGEWIVREGGRETGREVCVCVCVGGGSTELPGVIAKLFHNDRPHQRVPGKEILFDESLLTEKKQSLIS